MGREEGKTCKARESRRKREEGGEDGEGRRLALGEKKGAKVLCSVDYCVFVIWNGISCRYSISCP